MTSILPNTTLLSCPHCEEEYTIKWKNDDIEPTTCPFCGAESLIEEEDAVFSNDEEQDDWN